MVDGYTISTWFCEKEREKDPSLLPSVSFYHSEYPNLFLKLLIKKQFQQVAVRYTDIHVMVCMTNAACYQPELLDH